MLNQNVTEPIQLKDNKNFNFAAINGERVGFEFIFSNIDDMIDFTDDTKQVGILCMPLLEEVYNYQKNIGKGS